MDEIPNELLENAKRKLETVNWLQVIAILGIIGIIIFLLWFFFKKRKVKGEESNES